MPRIVHGFLGQRPCGLPSLLALSSVEGPESPKLTHCAHHLVFSFKHMASFKSVAEPLLDSSLTQMENCMAVRPVK